MDRHDRTDRQTNEIIRQTMEDGEQRILENINGSDHEQNESNNNVQQIKEHAILGETKIYKWMES